MSRKKYPFADLNIKEVPLIDPPLLRVITQVRFPLVMEIEDKKHIVPFQKSIKAQYPILKTVTQQGFAFSEKGIVEEKGEQIWQFFDKAEQWMVSLSPGFIALETTDYQSRSDLIERMRLLLDSLQSHFQPAHIERIGVRYIDRVEGKAFEQIDKMIHKDILGIAYPELRLAAQHILSEMQLKIKDGYLRSRWGFLPPNTTADPFVIEAIEADSWILDIDAFSLQKVELDIDQLLSQLDNFTQHSYAFFRWIVTDRFLTYYQQKRDEVVKC